MLMYPLEDDQVALAARHARGRGLFTIGEHGQASYARAAAAAARYQTLHTGTPVPIPCLAVVLSKKRSTTIPLMVTLRETQAERRAQA